MSKYRRQQRRSEQIQQPRQHHDQPRDRAFLPPYFMRPAAPGTVSADAK